MKNLRVTLLVAVTLPWMLFVVAPMTMLLGNRQEFAPNWHVLNALISLCMIAAALIFLTLCLLRSFPQLFGVTAGLVLAVGSGLWVQSQLMAWSFGPLDGRGVPWDNFNEQARLELLVWGIVPLLVWVACVASHKVIRHLAVLLPLIGAASLVVAWAGSNSPLNDDGAGNSQPAEQSLAFHPRHNTILLVLDSFQSDIFHEIFDRYPEEVSFLTGFRYFPDTVGGYPTTKHSIPLILTGKLYSNGFPWTPEKKRGFYSNSLIDDYQTRGYRVTGTFDRNIQSRGSQPIHIAGELFDYRFYGLSASQIRAVDVGIFRAMPIILKKPIYDDGRWWISKFRSDPQSPPEPHGSDWRFAQAFARTAHVESTGNGEFKFIHLIGAHFPVSMDERYQHLLNASSDRTGYFNQARGVMKMTKGLLQKLKELGIYENAEIMIVSDHGQGFIPKDMRGSMDDAGVPASHIGSARPLFLYKTAGANSALQVDSTPMHLAYISCLLSKSKKDGCQQYERVLSGATVTRHYLHYKWADEFWFKDYSPTMSLYEIVGDARDYESWRPTHTEFANGKAIYRNRYQLEEPIDFTLSGHAEQFLVMGWLPAEPTHRWTRGHTSELRIKLSHPPTGDLLLTVEAMGMPPDGNRAPQPVRVRANNVSVANWSVLNRQEYTALIPKAALEPDPAALDDALVVSFDMETPTAPCTISASADCRELGLAVTRVSVSNAP